MFSKEVKMKKRKDFKRKKYKKSKEVKETMGRGWVKVKGYYKRTGFLGLKKVYVRPHLKKK